MSCRYAPLRLDSFQSFQYILRAFPLHNGQALLWYGGIGILCFPLSFFCRDLRRWRIKRNGIRRRTRGTVAIVWVIRSARYTRKYISVGLVYASFALRHVFVYRRRCVSAAGRRGCGQAETRPSRVNLLNVWLSKRLLPMRGKPNPALPLVFFPTTMNNED